jgi:hypothetical protein
MPPPGGYEAIAKLLLSTGKVNPDSKAIGNYNAWRTPLWYATENGHGAIVKFLLNTGKVDPDSKATDEYDVLPCTLLIYNGLRDSTAIYIVYRVVYLTCFFMMLFTFQRVNRVHTGFVYEFVIMYKTGIQVLDQGN